jgi:hypothetical protein
MFFHKSGVAGPLGIMLPAIETFVRYIGVVEGRG